MTQDWPELTKLLTADVRQLRLGAPEVMKAFRRTRHGGRRTQSARRQDQGADRARYWRSDTLRRLHRLSHQSRGRSRRDSR